MSDPAPRPHGTWTPAAPSYGRHGGRGDARRDLLVTGVTVAVLYRHYNHNLDVEDITPELGNDRPTAPPVTAQKGPVNILVMGSDNRDAPGDHIDDLTGIGQRSDTTILLHLSGDRRRAYGVSVPRDSIVDRPACLGPDGQQISPPATAVMWNDAFNIGGPGCTARQFEQLTGIRIDHYVVVDFASFEGMVDAIGGVEVCIPQPIVDPKHGINIPAGTRRLTGRTALNYVRARYTIGDKSDLGREKRQQAFVASMFRQVLSAHTLADPLAVTGFLNSATAVAHPRPGPRQPAQAGRPRLRVPPHRARPDPVPHHPGRGLPAEHRPRRVDARRHDPVERPAAPTGRCPRHCSPARSMPATCRA